MWDFRVGDKVRVVSTQLTHKHFGWVDGLLRIGGVGIVRFDYTDSNRVRVSEDYGIAYSYHAADLELVEGRGVEALIKENVKLVSEMDSITTQINKLNTQMDDNMSSYRDNKAEILKQIAGAVLIRFDWLGEEDKTPIPS